MNAAKHTFLIRSAGAIACALLINGCAVGPNYREPELPKPATFRGGPKTPSAETIATLNWWDLYRDPTLQSLIREALQKNHDVRIAATRVEQARQSVIQSRSLYLPSFSVEGAASRGKNQVSGAPAYNYGATSDDAYALLGAAWEIDVWGRIRRLNESARALYFATEEGQRAVLLSLVADVARTYFELLELDKELDIATRTTESFTRSARIFGQRREGGVVSKLETVRADAALAQAAATVPELERQINAKENQICILLGRIPGPIERATRLNDGLVIPDVPAGLPADLIARRPDLRASEQALRAANADVGAAIAEYFPKIGLTSFLGQVSPDLHNFGGKSGNAWSVAATVSGPVFQWGRTRAQVNAAKARWEESKIQHERSVLIALAEVSDSLVARDKLALSREQLQLAVNSLTEAVEVSTQRYMNGKASYYEVLEAQQQLFPAENALARTELAQLLASVQLYKSLGGGWQQEPAKTPTP